MRATLIAAALATLVVAGALALTNDNAPTSRRAAAVPELPAATAGIDARIDALRTTVRLRPGRVEGHTLLASAYLDKLRQSGDPRFFDAAEQSVQRALVLEPRDPAALVERAALLMNRHFFPEGLAAARAARRAAPQSNRPLGILVDALIETGRYDEAARTLQQMADRKPDLAALSRVSYFRELHGDAGGALAALTAAASAGAATDEAAAFVQALIGDVELLRDRRAAARRAYRVALSRLPGHPRAELGLARLDLARGRHDAAIARLAGLATRRPAPEHTLALAEAEIAAGEDARGRRHLRRARAAERAAAAIEGVPQELAEIEADHGDPGRALAAAREAWREAPGVKSADVLGWALTRSGHPRKGLRWARRALSTGAVEPRFRYHAAVAALGAGERDLGRRWLRSALARPLRLTVLEEREARDLARR